MRSTKVEQQIKQLFAQAERFHQHQMFRQAEQAYQRLLQICPQHVLAYNNLGTMYKEQKRWEKAEGCFRQAIALQKDFAPAYYNLGNVWLNSGRPEDGLRCLEQANQLVPKQGFILLALGKAYMNLGQVARAKACISEAQEAQPDLPGSYLLMAELAYHEQEQETAIFCLEKYLRLQPDDSQAYLQMARLCYRLGRWEEALVASRKVRERMPDLQEAGFIEAVVLLQRGEWEEGFRLYENRFFHADYHQGVLGTLCQNKIPRWKGECFSGKRLLVWAEQGFGDTVQFSRYVKMVKQRGGHVTFAVWPELLRLFQGLEGADEILPFQDHWDQYDFQIPLLSLPHLFGTTVGTVPERLPYLPEVFTETKMLILPPRKGKLRVGLVWATENESSKEDGFGRSCAWEDVAALTKVRGISWCKLQLPYEGNMAVQENMVDMTEHIRDFSDTAALIGQLDLVISIDTAVAHVAAAMGKPVWLLLPYHCEWRWLDGRKDTPWYPTMRIFRQRIPGEWSSVMRQVTVALRDWKKNRDEKELDISSQRKVLV